MAENQIRKKTGLQKKIRQVLELGGENKSMLSAFLTGWSAQLQTIHMPMCYLKYSSSGHQTAHVVLSMLWPQDTSGIVLFAHLKAKQQSASRDYNTRCDNSMGNELNYNLELFLTTHLLKSSPSEGSYNQIKLSLLSILFFTPKSVNSERIMKVQFQKIEQLGNRGPSTFVLLAFDHSNKYLISA